MASLASPEAAPVTERTPEPIAVDNFEKATTAYAAVYSVKGRDHPLVSVDHGHMGELLVALEEADQTPHIFRDDDAQAIRESLQGLIEDSESQAGRLYGAPARAMLEGTLDATISAEAIGRPAGAEATDRKLPKTSVSPPTNDHKPARIAPASTEQPASRFMRRGLTLQSFGELATAKEAVVARSGTSVDLDKLSRSRIRALRTIDATIGRADPFKPDSYLLTARTLEPSERHCARPLSAARPFMTPKLRL